MNSQKKQHKKLHEVSLEKDIRYRGPLSYRHFKILGWLCIAIAQILVFASLSSRFAPEAELFPSGVVTVLQIIASMSLPLFLVANFAVILDTSDGYRKLMLINGCAAGGIIILYLFFYLRYILGVAGLVLEGRDVAASLINEAVTKSPPAFNIFVDLFLCTLFMFFIEYRPIRVFTGKKLLIFRMFSLAPVLYEAASLVIKYLAEEEVLVMPAAILPFLTTKPPIMFLVFIILAFFIKNRERLFCKYGRSRQEYKMFLESKRNSLHFSAFTAIVFLAAGVADLILFTIFANAIETGIEQPINLIKSLNLGDSITLIFMAPLIMLFSYTRKHKSGIVDILIPVLGVALIIFIYIEGAYQAIINFLPAITTME